jgi:fructose-1,6-bisphosphatase/inositol monophosphatase family enzyme
MRPDPHNVAALIAEIAQDEIAPYFGKLTADAVREKSAPGDLVTIVDEAAERALRLALKGLVPSASFIGEEAAAADPSIVDALRGEGAFWIVDPLDGTRNFVRGEPEFGTIVAYAENGRTLMGWIHAIPDAATAIGVSGAGVEWRGERLSPERRVADPPEGYRSTGWLSPAWKDRLVEALRSKVRSRPGNCAAYAYLALLRGETDFNLSSRVHPWDHAAGALMLAEASGAVRWLERGDDYAPAPSRDAPLLATAPGRSWIDIAGRLLG